MSDDFVLLEFVDIMVMFMVKLIKYYKKLFFHKLNINLIMKKTVKFGTDTIARPYYSPFPRTKYGGFTYIIVP